MWRHCCSVQVGLPGFCCAGLCAPLQSAHVFALALNTSSDSAVSQACSPQQLLSPSPAEKDKCSWNSMEEKRAQVGSCDQFQ